MAALAVDLFALVLRRGVVHDQHHRLIRRSEFQNQRGQHASQRPVGPDPQRQNAMKIAPMSLGQGARRAQHAGDGSLAHRHDGPEDQDGDALESGACECYGEPGNQRLRRLGQTHVGLLSESQDVIYPRLSAGVRSFDMRNFPCESFKKRQKSS
jgi:hypothetical protein